ncbi:MAG: hypothetical protein IKR34_07220 [Candidatus Gastranaerophilales bacterium]|nr:hypothetical protein [Candidatus Gastranaerophilales bacterium]
MEKLIKDNIVIIALVVLAIIAGGYYTYNIITETSSNYTAAEEKKTTLQTKKDQLAQQLAANKKREEQLETTSNSGKVIYEVSGEQFSPEASFGIMFENVLSNITNSGVRIRSIDYNYQPADDTILLTNIPGYNACELSFITVSNYTQLQALFKNIAKEKYLSSINEVFIEPYDKDKTILISKFKIRLYTKTI